MSPLTWTPLNLPLGPIYEYVDESAYEDLYAKSNFTAIRLLERQEADSLHKRGLLRPGVFIRVREEYGEGSNVELIGSINTEGGTCNCCYATTPSSLVLEYIDLFPNNENYPS